MHPHELPVYREKERILKALSDNQIIVVESPTGSGKTTQIPIILHEAGYASKGVIGVTQPRRIAAVSVCDYIARQLDSPIPGPVGYKMRFEDRTNQQTRIKIMTDGILLQELKADWMLSSYSVILVDEAHERSLNIDFILGLLKRILESRPEFKVIISSATINAEVFSQYFNQCPIVHIETAVYPVTIIYDPPKPEDGPDAIIPKIESIVTRTVHEKRPGDILIFLSGEQMIKDCITSLYSAPFRKKLLLLPLYARLSKEEQERVFIPTPAGKTKIICATNIAETSVTIEGITTVIDSGLAKMNYYNPRSFTASLVEGPVSKASCNQRKGRAGRTQPGVCYRLYTKSDFETRPLYSLEEIYRTDLSEVVLRMAELSITDFESFDFISPPGTQGILGAVETLHLLDALTPDRKLSSVGELMARFPLLPRHSRIIVEAVERYPDSLDDILVATAFLTTNSPFLLPAGEELEARKAHHHFRDVLGDFVSYLKMYRAYLGSAKKDEFCEKYYLDIRTMAEIANIKEQLAEIVSEMGIPIGTRGSHDDYLCAISRGLIQFACGRTGRGVYRSMTAEKIQIHPGSVMFREDPRFIVAGEIVRTSKMYARSVSPLTKEQIEKISPVLAESLLKPEKPRETGKGRELPKPVIERAGREPVNQLFLGGERFELHLVKGRKKLVVLPWDKISGVIKSHEPSSFPNFKNIRGKVTHGNGEMFGGMKLNTILKILPYVNPDTDTIRDWPKGRTFSSGDAAALGTELNKVLKLCPSGKKGSGMGFLAIETDGNGKYWFRCVKSFNAALDQSLAALESLADEISEDTDGVTKEHLNSVYRKLQLFFET